MKKIGLVGGLSWVSTAEYYRLINELIRVKLGGYHSAHVLIESLDENKFLEMAKLDPSEKLCEKMIIDAVDVLRRGGAEVIALCANGVHRFEPAIKENCNVDIVHIADSTAKEVEKSNIKNIGLLGVMKTMEGDFYRDKLSEKNIVVHIPNTVEKNLVHDKIMSELVLGKFTQETEDLFVNICMSLNANGAEGVILGCTEIPLLMKNVESLPMPLFSTTEIHCKAIVDAACAKVTLLNKNMPISD
ncbi:Aspartate racemase [Moritella sp. JT01]|nr:Aspartate racemase [Moritella sp. JT01]